MKIIFFALVLIWTGLIPKLVWSQSENMQIIQSDSVYTLSPGNHSILLERKPFVIRASVKKYKERKMEFNALQLAVRNTNAGMCRAGLIISDIPYFAPGTGIAAEKDDAYPFLFINDEAHHYFTVQNKNNKRVDQAIKSKGLYLVDIRVNGFNDKGKDILIEEFKGIELFMDILINKNLNELIDQDELTQIHLRFH